MKFISDQIRSSFPSLQSRAVFFDNPGGTQVPVDVMAAQRHYFETANANVHGVFATSQKAGQVVDDSRLAMADFLNSGSSSEIIFGANMTTLTFHISRSLLRMMQPGDEVIVTHLDHDANIAPWLSLEESGIVVRWLDFNPQDCTLDMDELEKKLCGKTRIIAVGYASNAVGTINPLKEIIAKARSVGAMVYVDAVHYAPHGPIDVQDIDCDFLVCSPYKFYGPHAGVLYGKYEHLINLVPYKVRPAEKTPPESFETGTQNHEALAGITAAIDFIAAIGENFIQDYRPDHTSFSGRRLALKAALSKIQSFEADLFGRLLSGVEQIPGIRVYGITDRERSWQRTPTLAFTMAGFTPKDIAEQLAEQGIYVWDGNYYALALMERLGLEERGGAVRVGLACYNTAAEVDFFLQTLATIQKKKGK